MTSISRERAFGVVALLVYGGLWVAFGYALLADPGALDEAWSWIAGLPLVLQLVAWLLFLPLVAGLWVWQTDWPLAVRLVLEAGLAVATIYAFFPKWLLAGMRPAGTR